MLQVCQALRPPDNLSKNERRGEGSEVTLPRKNFENYSSYEPPTKTKQDVVSI